MNDIEKIDQELERKKQEIQELLAKLPEDQRNVEKYGLSDISKITVKVSICIDGKEKVSGSLQAKDLEQMEHDKGIEAVGGTYDALLDIFKAENLGKIKKLDNNEQEDPEEIMS